MASQRYYTSHMLGSTSTASFQNSSIPEVSSEYKQQRRSTTHFRKSSVPQVCRKSKPRKRLSTPFRSANSLQVSSLCMPLNRPNDPFRNNNLHAVASARFQDLGLSGLSRACDPGVNCVRTVFWGCLWLAALLWCVFGITNCVVTFASSPFTVNVKFKENQTIIPPHLTVCPTDVDYRNPAVSPLLLRERYCNTSYKNALDLLQNCNMTIDSLWNISRFEMKEPLYRLFETVKWLDGFTFQVRKEIQKIELKTIHGICLMFKTGIPLRCMGMQNGLDIEGHALMPNQTITAGYYMGVIHSEEQIPLIRYTGTIRNGFYGAFKQLTTVGLRVQQVIHSNTWKNPCQPDASYQNCLIQCIERKIISESTVTPCRLPYMNEMLPLPLCKTEDEFSAMFSATQSAVHEVNPDTCGCIKPCNKVRYREDYFLPYPVEHLMGLYLMIPHCDIEVIEEELNYGFTSFLSDIGGNLGLFLGMSVLSILEVLEVLFWKTLAIARLFSN